MKKRYLLLFVAAVLLLSSGVGYLVYSVTAQKQRASVYEEIRHEVVRQRTLPEQTQDPVDLIEPTPEPYVSPIDFEKLHAVNEDIYAWIEIEGTGISYPIVQSQTDDNYYLDHTIEGHKGYPGSIFTSNVNTRDFTDFNTVIYGHNMKDGTMFGDLSSWRDETWLMEHRTIRIYLPEQELTYKVFAAVVYDDRLITSWYDNDDPESCRAFLDTIYGNRDINSHILDDVAVTQEDRIITLSTCIGGRPNNRYLLLAVLQNEDAQ